MRGRLGGLRLAMPTNGVNIGHLVRSLESQTDLVECMRPDGGNCILAPACGLTHALRVAQDAFFASLDTLTLSDLTRKDAGMERLLSQLNTN